MDYQFRKTPRAPFLNYEEGCYFVTICTKNMAQYLGHISDKKMYLSAIGLFLDEQIRKASEFYPQIEVPHFVVMPNHLHMILLIKPTERTPSSVVERDYLINRCPVPFLRHTDNLPRQIPTLSKYVNSLKGSVSKFAKGNNPDFGWQSRYHDHRIRNHQEYEHIANYIQCNVPNWTQDRFFSDAE